MQKFSAHKPKGVIYRFKDRLRFLLERLLLRGLGYRLLLAAMIVVAVAIIAGELAIILVPEISDAGDAIWWAFLRLSLLMHNTEFATWQPHLFYLKCYPSQFCDPHGHLHL